VTLGEAIDPRKSVLTQMEGSSGLPLSPEMPKAANAESGQQPLSLRKCD
jgi:hypothetical protein